MSRRTPAAGLAIAIAALGAVSLAPGCSGVPSTSDRIIVEGPPAGIFINGPTGGVDAVFERRCGSLDCHGQYGRPLRIYSQYGLRMPNPSNAGPGSGPTTTEEQNENYRSIVALEPEKMTNIIKSIPNGDPFTLLILEKPLNRESHKGGPVISKDDATSQCLAAWIGKGTLDPNCMAAALLP
jgi:hypothetical protein